MKLNHLAKIIFLTAMALILEGCKSKSVNFSQWSTSGTSEEVEDKRIITDSKLNKRLLVDSVETVYGDDGLLQVQARLRNLTKKLISVEYRFDWIDENNMEVSTPASRWIIKHIYGGDIVTVSGVAPNDQARTFTLKFKRR